jgi:hypothetical protein
MCSKSSNRSCSAGCLSSRAPGLVGALESWGRPRVRSAPQGHSGTSKPPQKAAQVSQPVLPTCGGQNGAFRDLPRPVRSSKTPGKTGFRVPVALLPRWTSRVRIPSPARGFVRSPNFVPTRSPNPMRPEPTPRSDRPPSPSREVGQSSRVRSSRPTRARRSPCARPSRPSPLARDPGRCDASREVSG